MYDSLDVELDYNLYVETRSRKYSCSRALVEAVNKLSEARSKAQRCTLEFLDSS